MSETKKTKTRIEYEMPNDRTFQYTGKIISQNDNLIVFEDEKIGVLTLNVKRVILIKEVD